MKGSEAGSRSPFPFSLDNKRYHTWNYYLTRRFGGKVGKVALDGGFTCPNRDGTKGWGGCSYCSPRGSGDYAGDPALDIKEQFAGQRAGMLEKWPGARCIAYLQAYSGTYAPIERLERMFYAVLDNPDVVGLCIATRADVLGPEVMELLEALSRRTWLMVELGLQSIHDVTALRVNRCHSYADFLTGYRRLRQSGIDVCVHIINGLPGETRRMMLETGAAVGALSPHSIKIHMLHVLKDTALVEELRSGKLLLLDQEAYTGLVCDQLELLPPQVVVQRLTGDPPENGLLAPGWVLQKRRVLNGIDRELARRDSWQGKRLPAPPRL